MISIMRMKTAAALAAAFLAAASLAAQSSGGAPAAKGWLGANLGDSAPPPAAAALKLKTCIFVANLITGSPAEKAGLLPGDYIVSYMGGVAPNGVARFISDVQASPAGSRFSLRVLRGQAFLDIRGVLGTRTEDPSPKKLWPGFFVAEADLAAAQKLGPGKGFAGVVAYSITEGAPGGLAGLVLGDGIESVDGAAVANPDQFYAALAKTGPRAALGVRRGAQRLELVMEKF